MNSSSPWIYVKRGGLLERARAAYYITRFFRHAFAAQNRSLSRERFSCLAHGFHADKLGLYDFARYGYGAYLSDINFIIGTGRINGPYRLLLNDKLAFHWLMGTSPRARVRLFAYVQSGLLHYPDSTARDRLHAYIREGRTLVFKPVRGGGGKGLRLWTPSNDSKDALSSLQLAISSLDDYLVTEHIEQARYARDIFPEAANTIRLLTMWDFENGRPFLGAATHRFATLASQPVDNFSFGGLTAAIDVQDGRLGAGVSRSPGSDLRSTELRWSDTHPDTGAQIAGVQIPAWDGLVDGLLSIAAYLPSIRYVGWDVAITDAGFRILEANNAPDPNIIQIHRPLLLDARNREFYQRVGAI